MSDEVTEAVEAVFRERLLEQSQRLAVFPKDVESPGQWRDRVRKAALVEAMRRAAPPPAQPSGARQAMLDAAEFIETDGSALDAKRADEIVRILRALAKEGQAQ